MRQIMTMCCVAMLGLSMTTVEAQSTRHMQKLGREAAEGSHQAIDEIEQVLTQAEKDKAGHKQEKKSPHDLVTAAFEPLNEEAGKGSQIALEALKYANGKQALRSFTTPAFGKAAASGNKEALNMLLNYKENGWLLSSVVFALQGAAEKNTPEAVDFLLQVMDDPSAKPLWPGASQGLVGAASLGNEKAKAALKKYSKTTH